MEKKAFKAMGKLLQLPYANRAKFGPNIHRLSSRYRSPPVSGHIGVTFWMVTYGMLDCII